MSEPQLKAAAMKELSIVKCQARRIAALEVSLLEALQWFEALGGRKHDNTIARLRAVLAADQQEG